MGTPNKSLLNFEQGKSFFVGIFFGGLFLGFLLDFFFFNINKDQGPPLISEF